MMNKEILESFAYELSLNLGGALTKTFKVFNGESRNPNEGMGERIVEFNEFFFPFTKTLNKYEKYLNEILKDYFHDLIRFSDISRFPNYFIFIEESKKSCNSISFWGRVKIPNFVGDIFQMYFLDFLEIDNRREQYELMYKLKNLYVKFVNEMNYDSYEGFSLYNERFKEVAKKVKESKKLQELSFNEEESKITTRIDNDCFIEFCIKFNVL